MANLGLSLNVDISDAMNGINFLKDNMNPRQFESAMKGIFQRTARHVTTILRADLPKEYYVPGPEITKAVRNPIMQNQGCIIPIMGRRGSIGGFYKASGSAPGWASVYRKYRVKAKIVTSGESVLPESMGSYGGKPPFRNSTAKKLNGVTFTRAGKKRLPIEKVSGIAIPQMPDNRSRDQVENDIAKYLEQRVEQRITALIINGR